MTRKVTRRKKNTFAGDSCEIHETSHITFIAELLWETAIANKIDYKPNHIKNILK